MVLGEISHARASSRVLLPELFGPTNGVRASRSTSTTAQARKFSTRSLVTRCMCTLPSMRSAHRIRSAPSPPCPSDVPSCGPPSKLHDDEVSASPVRVFPTDFGRKPARGSRIWGEGQREAAVTSNPGRFRPELVTVITAPGVSSGRARCRPRRHSRYAAYPAVVCSVQLELSGSVGMSTCSGPTVIPSSGRSPQ